MPEPSHDHAHVVAPPPLIYAGGLAAGLLLQRYQPLRFYRQGSAGRSARP
jgi:hypothetical protein